MTTASRRRFLKTSAALTAWPALALPQRPRLLVVVIAGHFRTDYFDSHTGLFGAGGFRRLIETGAFFPDARLDSVSFTAPGLATIAAGAPPSVHGIVADRWFERGKREAVNATPEHLRATTFFSEFTALDPRNRLITAGFDPSVLSGTASYRMNGEGRVQGPGAWVEAFNKNYTAPRDQKLNWFPIGSKSNVPMRTFAYDASRVSEFLTLWKGSPLGQAAKFALAREIITQEKLGRGAGLDCLVVTLDAFEILGHEGGASSPLVFDLVSHLDRQIESFIDFLESALGAAGYSLVFTAAHGVADARAAAVNSEDVVAAVTKALGAETVEAYVYPFLYLRKPAHDSRLAACRAVFDAGLVHAWYTADGECSHTGEFRARLANSFHTGRSGDAIFVYAPGAMEFFGNGRGVSYGSIYNYDTQVPLILRGPQFRAKTFEGPVEIANLAPTLARAMGTPTPSSSTGRTLGEAFKS